LILRISSALE